MISNPARLNLKSSYTRSAHPEPFVLTVFAQVNKPQSGQKLHVGLERGDFFLLHVKDTFPLEI